MTIFRVSIDRTEYTEMYVECETREEAEDVARREMENGDPDDWFIGIPDYSYNAMVTKNVPAKEPVWKNGQWE